MSIEAGRHVSQGGDSPRRASHANRVRGMAPGLLFACGALSGCSLFFTQHVALPVGPVESVGCTESRAAPAADTVLTAALVAGAVALVVKGHHEPQVSPFESAGSWDFASALVLGTLAAGEGVVALVGYERTSRCQRIRDGQRRCLGGDRDACAALQSDQP